MARSIKKGSVVVAVGTKKGGFLFHSSDRKKWSVAGPFMEGGSVYHMLLDPRDGRTVYASAPMGSEPWGPAIYWGCAVEVPNVPRVSARRRSTNETVLGPSRASIRNATSPHQRSPGKHQGQIPSPSRSNPGRRIADPTVERGREPRKDSRPISASRSPRIRARRT